MSTKQDFVMIQKVVEYGNLIGRGMGAAAQEIYIVLSWLRDGINQKADALAGQDDNLLAANVTAYNMIAQFMIDYFKEDSLCKIALKDSVVDKTISVMDYILRATPDSEDDDDLWFRVGYHMAVRIFEQDIHQMVRKIEEDVDNEEVRKALFEHYRYIIDSLLDYGDDSEFEISGGLTSVLDNVFPCPFTLESGEIQSH